MSNGFNNMAEDEDFDSSKRKFQAVVVDNNDPLKRQRIKVSIPSLMEGEVDDLPWVGPLVQSSFGMTPVAATVCVPEIHSVVSVSFQDGDLNFGLYEASLHTERTPIPPVLATNYPKRRGWVDPAGNQCYFDTTSGSVSFFLRHKSGTTFQVSDNGAVTVTGVQDVRVSAPRIYLN